MMDKLDKLTQTSNEQLIEKLADTQGYINRCYKSWAKTCKKMKISADFNEPNTIIEGLLRENEELKKERERGGWKDWENVLENNLLRKANEELKQDKESIADLCSTLNNKIITEEKINEQYKIEQKELLEKNGIQDSLIHQLRFKIEEIASDEQRFPFLFENNQTLRKENEELKRELSTKNKWNQQYGSKHDMCPLV